MSIPIEDQDNALSFLSKLRQWKPLVVIASRDVAVTDFGRLIILSGNGINLNLPNQALARSGSVRVTKLSNAEVNLVECGLTINNVVNLSSKVASHDDIRFDGALGNPVDYVDLIYNHETDIWYFLPVMQHGLFDGLPTDISGHAARYNPNAELQAAGIRFPLGDASGGEMAIGYSNPSWFITIVDNAGATALEINFGSPSDISSLSLNSSTLEEVSGQSNLFVTCEATGYADDVAAGAGGVDVGQIYLNSTSGRFQTRLV